MTFGESVAATWPLLEVSGASGFHWPPKGRDSSVTLPTPRASPARRTCEPKTTGAAGAVRFSIPIVNQVERIPSAARAAGAADRPVAARPDQRQRPHAPGSGRVGLDVEQQAAGAEPPAEHSRREAQRPPVVVGRKRVVGVRHRDQVGDRAELGHTSCTFAVLPPELEKKNVSASSPL